MPAHRFKKSVLTGAVLAACAVSWPVSADQEALLELLRGMEDGTWLKISQNRLEEVFIPLMERPQPNTSNSSEPHKVIYAWSSFAWDVNSSDMYIYGGGHSNYIGNEVYKFNSSTLLWEVAALPSNMQAITANGLTDWIPVAPDNGNFAPSSAHTYDNTLFLPRADRVITFGGAAYNSGFAYKKLENGQAVITGPYLFDPNKADSTKVGGPDGTGTNPETPGGNMWSNRDIYSNIIGADIPTKFVDGTSAYAYQDGHEVIYKTAQVGGGTKQSLFKYTIVDIDQPGLDTWEQVGRPVQNVDIQSAGAFDPVRNLYVRTGDSSKGLPFVFWDLNNASPDNNDIGVTGLIAPDDFFVDGNYGIDYDPLGDRFLVWKGGSAVYSLTVGNLDGTGWTIERDSAPGEAFPGAPVEETVLNGVLGKWQFASDLNAFVGLENGYYGHVWLYRPTGWEEALPVPEPTEYALMGVGLLVLGGMMRRRARRARQAEGIR
ncbi:MAG: PEP-CTERM sorting domain-containing protein [Burkholderiales bacterium]|nr:PEP-CTERM sorting domain-containing protein [Burkholderiales bacterium]